MLPNERIDPLFQATIEATEEAVVNAMLAAETMTGADGIRVFGLPGDRVVAALKKYNDMNKLAMQVIKPGGVLPTSSCTGLVSEEEFLDMIRRAAFYAGRTVQVLKVAGAGADHPFMAHVKESRYLKAVFCRVE